MIHDLEVNINIYLQLYNIAKEILQFYMAVIGGV